MEQNDDLLHRLAKHQKTGLPYCNRTMECLSVRLKMPQFTCITLQPLIEANPKTEMIIVKKAKRGFYEDMIELQNFLMMSYHMGSYRGVSITQEYLWYQGQLGGFLKAQINMTHCTMPRDKVIRLFDYGMTDWIIFNKPEESLWSGEKIKVVIRNITVSESESVQAQIYSFPQKSYRLTEKPAKHEIFMVPISSAFYYTHEPTDIQFMDHMDFYLFLE